MSEKRRFSIHNPDEVASMQEAFKRKIDANRQKGQDAITTGRIEPFRGFNFEKSANEYNYVLELTPESQRDIMNQAVYPLREIAQKHGVEAIYPSLGDMPPHVTIEFGVFKNLSPEERKQLLHQLDHNYYLDIIGKILSGLDFSYDQLVFSGRDSYLCVGEFNSDIYPIYKARKLIERVYRKTLKDEEGSESGLTVPFEYKDILHTTVSRTTELPFNHDELKKFMEEVDEKVAIPIRKNPIPVSVESAFHGSTLLFLQENNAPFSA